MKRIIEVTIITLILMKPSLPQLSVNNTLASYAHPLTDCISFIFKKYLNATRKISVRYSIKQRPIASELLKKINLPVMINAEEIPKIRGLDTRLPNEAAVIMEDSFNVTNHLNRTLWITKTYFLVVTSKPETMTQLFREFWNHNAVNVIVLIPNGETVLVYTFMPYNEFDCGVGKPILLTTWPSENFKFFQKTFENLNNCTLNVTVVNLPPTAIFPNNMSHDGVYNLDGIEARILIEVSKKLHFQLKFSTAKDGEAWGWIEPSPHGVVGEVHLRKSQFGFSVLAPTLERFEYLDITVPSTSEIECITWVVPLGAGKSQPIWIKLLLNEFSAPVWYSMIIVVAATTFAFRIFSRISEPLFSDNIEPIFYVLTSSFGFPVKIPITLSVRILFLTWIWYSFVIIIAYQSSMGSKLTVPLPNPNINTFKELLESKLQLTGFYNTFRLVHYYSDVDPEVKAISNRLKQTSYGLDEAIKRIIANRNIAYMRESTTLAYNAMINHHVKGLVHLMKQCVYDYFPIMVLQKRYPLTERVNEIITRLQEAGIMKQWRSQFLYDLPQSSPPVIKLSFKHMTGPFFVLLLGIATSNLVFMIEYLRSRLWKKLRD